MWKKIDIKTSLYAKKTLPSELFVQNIIDVESPGNAFLVCKVRNRTGMRVYATMQYRDGRGNTSNVEFLCSEFNPEKWTTFTMPIQISAEDLLKTKKNEEIRLKPIKIEAK